MHRSRLSGFIIDCETLDVEAAAPFWSSALGMQTRPTDDQRYLRLDASARDLVIEVQAVSHASRVHLDIETDNVEAEVERLERLGARRLLKVRTFWVLEAPTGQRFCVVMAKGDLTRAPGTNVWP
jgi:hypothetical protein